MRIKERSLLLLLLLCQRLLLTNKNSTGACAAKYPSARPLAKLL